MPMIVFGKHGVTRLDAAAGAFAFQARVKCISRQSQKQKQKQCRYLQRYLRPIYLGARLSKHSGCSFMTRLGI
jgi:hypothetical protein